MNKFEVLVVELIDEDGQFDVPIALPYYLEIEKNREIRYPLDEHTSNYEISSVDFDKFLKTLIEINKKYEIGLYKYIKDSNKEEGDWDDCYNFIPDEIALDMMSKQDFWKPKKHELYTLSEKD
jgi:hypothetical protein